MIFLRYSTDSQEVPVGPALDSTDGNTEETGLTIANTDIKIWKTGATTLVNKNSGGASHISNGVYYAVFDSIDTNTLGSGRAFVHVSGALYCIIDFCVLPQKIYDSFLAGTDNLEVDAIQISGDATAADNLETACDNYSATRGLAGTALPAAAADAAGGLPISDAGGLDIDTILGRITEARMGVLTDWINGGRLDLLLDALLDRITETRAGYLDYINSIYGKMPSKAYLTGTANADGDIQANEATGNFPGSVDSVSGAVGSVTGNVGGSVASVTAGVTVASASIQAIWEYSTRTLSSFGTLVADIATAVWGAGTRTLSGFGTLVADIWAYTTRRLTDATNITSNGSTISQTQLSTIEATIQKVDTTLELDGAVYRFTVNALENSPVGSGDFTSDDRTKLESVFNKLPSKSYLTGTANSDGDVQLNEATGTPADSSGITTLLSRVTAAVALSSDMSTLLSRLSALRAGYLDNLSGGAVALGSDLATIAGYLDTEIAAILSIAQKLDTTLELDGAVYRFTINALENSPVGTGGFTATDREHLEEVLLNGATLLKQNSILDLLSAIEIMSGSILLDTDTLQQNLVPDTSINDRAKTEDDVITVYRTKTSGKRYRFEDLE